MTNWGSGMMERRAVLAGMLATSALALPGCATIQRDTTAELIRRLLEVSTQRAFARLVQPDGFWDSSVARINLPVLFGRPGKLLSGVLKSEAFRERLQHKLNNIAEDGARRAAPVVADAVRSTTFADAVGLLRGGRTAATTYLRQTMGSALVNAMIPELQQVMSVADDPLLGTALSALVGVDIGDAAHALAIEADNAIWYEIGASEAEVRDDPSITNDPLLIAGLRAL